MPVTLASRPWFCISIADRTPARCAPTDTPTPSSSLASRTRIMSGSASARLTRCTSQVSGSTESSRTPHCLSPSYTSFELAADTGIGCSCSPDRRDAGGQRSIAERGMPRAATIARMPELITPPDPADRSERTDRSDRSDGSKAAAGAGGLDGSDPTGSSDGASRGDRQSRRPRPPHGRQLAGLCLSALGIVYGDIGTSPLYAMHECFHASHGVPVTRENILGVLSLIFWALVIIVTLKYHVYILRADNHGEGGILALMALVRAKISGQRQAALFVGLGLFGAALLYGDGAITPAIF